MGIYDESPDSPKKINKKSKTIKKQKTSKEIKKNSNISAEEFFNSIKPIPEYIKHLIECRCILPQFINLQNPPNHKFIAFSELDEKANIKQSYIQCNNCGIIHKILEVNQSITLKKETMMTLPTVEDIKTSCPDWLIGILDKHQCSDLHTWQEAKFILDNELWGKFIVLAKEKEEDKINGKILQILGKELYKIDFFEREDGDVKLEQ